MNALDELIEQSRDRDFGRRIDEQRDLDDWINMPGSYTHRTIEQWIKTYRNRRMKTGLVIRLRVYIPDFERRHTWRCWVELTKESGKLYKNHKYKASTDYCESIFTDKSWEYVKRDTTSFYTKPIGNPVI